MNTEIMKKLEAWLDEHFDELVEDIKRIVSVPSVSNAGDGSGYPFGEGPKRALDEMLAMAGEYGFETRNYEDMCGSATLRPGASAGDEIGFWAHLDVVPPGDGWQHTEPYAPVLRDGYLIGRGAGDNKGPAVGAMHLLRAFEELNIPTNHGLRLFFGCDEEVAMRDVSYYTENYPAQKLALIPDTGFPVCYGEKGIISASVVTAPLTTVTRFEAGMADNIVPDKALLVMKGSLAAPLDDEWVEASVKDGKTVFRASGRAQHSASPENGVNAIHKATCAALASGLLGEQDAPMIDFLKRINDDCRGTALGIDSSDELSGVTTCAGTMASMTEDGRASLRLNIRYCITADPDELLANMREACAANGCELRDVHLNAANYFPRENPVIDVLTNVYNELTGKDAQPYTMGGGTYARKLKNAVGFGLGGIEHEPTDLFAVGHGGAHQPDEGLHLESFKRALLIFAMGVLEADRVLAEQN